MQYRHKLTHIIFSLVLALFFTVSPVLAIPSSYQICATSTTCEIGEFLYDDSYVPLTGASCTLTSKDPSGSTFLNAVALTGQSDGWYSYSLDTTGETEGLYRSQLCCTSGSDYLCLDKTFTIGSSSSTLTATEIENAVLDANLSDHTTDGTVGKNINTIGSIVSDVWAYSSRSLSTFGTLISQIWQHDPTDATTTTNSVFNEIYNEINSNRTLLEELVNEPIIKTFIEEGQALNLQAKIDTTRDYTNELYANTQSLKSRLKILSLKWNSLSEREISSELTIIGNALGANTQNPGENSIVAYANWLEESWGNPLTNNLANYSHTALTSILTLTQELSYYGKNKTDTTALTNTIDNISTIEDLIGDVSNNANDPTLFGHLRKVQQRAQIIDEHKNQLSELIIQLDSTSQNEMNSTIDDVEDRVLAINEFKSAASILKRKFGTIRAQLKNRIFSLDAILDVNKSLLASNAGDPVSNIWLEEGSIVFRTIITNPSTIISQTVPVKYYFPVEVKKEDIIDIDPALSINFDPNENTLYAEGEFDIEPEESVLVFVEVENIWTISDEEINSLKQQAADLLAPLEKTSFFGQGATLKSDIDVTLDKILANQDINTTPANKIRTYRESKLELLGVAEKLTRLKELVAQADSAGSIVGFVGGAQTVTVWGLILIFIGGFVFMTLYIRSLSQKPKKKKLKPATPTLKPDKAKIAKPDSLITPARPKPALLTLIIIILITGSISVVILTAIVTKIRQSESGEPALVAPIEEATPTPTPDNSADKPTEPENKTVLGSSSSSTLKMFIQVPPGSSANIRSGPGSDNPALLTVNAETEVYIFGMEKDADNETWMKIGFTEDDQGKDWWIHQDLLANIPLE